MTLQLDQPYPRTPGVADLDTVGHGHNIASGLAQPLLLSGKQIRPCDLQREPGEPRRLVVAAAGAGALPDGEAEMVVIAAGGEERRALALARRIEADRVAIEPACLRQIADAQMHVPDAQPVRCLRII